jgi:hypothetical protein
MIYAYKVKKRSLTDTEKHCLKGQNEVLSNLSPRQLKKYYCADFQFPNGDIFVLQPSDVHLDSVECVG